MSDEQFLTTPENQAMCDITHNCRDPEGKCLWCKQPRHLCHEDRCPVIVLAKLVERDSQQQSWSGHNLSVYYGQCSDIRRLRAALAEAQAEVERLRAQLEEGDENVIAARIANDLIAGSQIQLSQTDAVCECIMSHLKGWQQASPPACEGERVDVEKLADELTELMVPRAWWRDKFLPILRRNFPPAALNPTGENDAR